MSQTPRRHRLVGRVRLGVLALVLAAFPATAAAHGYGYQSHNHGSSSHHRGVPSHHLGHHGHPSGPPRPRTEPDPLSTASLMSTIDQYGSSPNHYSGTQADWSEENTVAEQFIADGLKVNSIAYNFPRFQPTHISLSVDSTYFPASALAPLLYSGVTGPEGIKAPLEAVAENAITNAANGKIVVASALSKSSIAASVPKAIAAGAVAEVFVTNSLDNFPAWEDVNSRQGTGSLPVILIGKKSGAELIADAAGGKEAVFTLQAELGTATDYDVWGELPGVDTSRRVFVGTPVSSMVPSASERGGGVAVLLALRRHYAEEPQSQRSE